jgi:hypothetical protein
MRFPSLLLTAILTLLLGLACSGLGELEMETRPPPTPQFVGQWEGPGLRMHIESDGTVEVQHVDDGNSSEFKAPAMSWDGGEIKIGIGPFTKVYTLNEAPHLVDDQWRMVVNGIVLVRTDGPPLQIEMTGKPIDAVPIEAVPIEAVPIEPAPTPAP